MGTLVDPIAQPFGNCKSSILIFAKVLLTEKKTQERPDLLQEQMYILNRLYSEVDL